MYDPNKTSIWLPKLMNHYFNQHFINLINKTKKNMVYYIHFIWYKIYEHNLEFFSREKTTDGKVKNVPDCFKGTIYYLFGLPNTPDGDGHFWWHNLFGMYKGMELVQPSFFDSNVPLSTPSEGHKDKGRECLQMPQEFLQTLLDHDRAS